jgi:type I restriction enzyme S subunit
MNDLVQKRSGDIPPLPRSGLETSASGAGDGIADSWQFKRIGSLAQVKGGKRLPKGARLLTEPTPFPYIRVCDFNAFSVDLSDIQYLTPAIQEKISRYIITKDDVFISIAGTIGRVGTIPETLDGANLTENAARIVLVGDGRLDKEFLKYCLASPEIQNDITSRRSKNAQPKLALTQIKDLEIPLPPLPEQKKIAHILSTVQRAIEAQERIIQTTTELKKALMHKLFTEGLRNEPQKQTEIGLVPESWEVMELGDFFQIKHGFAFDGTFFKPAGEYILMTPGHFHEEGGFRDQGEKTKYFTGEIPQDYVLAKDDLVVAMTEQKSGLLGSSAFVPEDGRYLHNQRLGLIVDLDNKRLSKSYLFNVFNLPHLRVEVAKTSTGSKVKHTSPTKLRAVKVGIPPTLEEQEDIATALATTEQKIRGATNKKTQLHDLFRTLLHELMTAKIRVHQLKFQLPTSAS